MAMNDGVKKNPTWTRDEILLALDLYFELDPRRMVAHDPQIIQFSDLLNDLPIHDDRTQNSKFRNLVGVSMKLRNFLRFDPVYQGKGLARGGRLEEVIWAEFACDREKLRRIAQAIRDTYGELVESQRRGAFDEESEVERPEGSILLRVHQLRERNKGLVQKKKAQVLRKTSMLACEVCGFDFFRTYGDLGNGFAECHHIVPLAALNQKVMTSLDDLVVVCANCHRMFHRNPTWLSIDELKLRMTTAS